MKGTNLLVERSTCCFLDGFCMVFIYGISIFNPGWLTGLPWYLSFFPSLPFTHLSIEIPAYMRWCVLSSGEQQKCVDMASAFQSESLTPAIQCVFGDSVTDCMEKIKVTDISYSGFLKNGKLQWYSFTSNQNYLTLLNCKGKQHLTERGFF